MLKVDALSEVFVAAESKHIKAALENLRTFFEKGTPDLEILEHILQADAEVCSQTSLEAFAKSKKTFTTGEAMQHFQLVRGKLAGTLAKLSQSGVVRVVGKKDANGHSQYVWVKPQSRATTGGATT